MPLPSSVWRYHTHCCCVTWALPLVCFQNIQRLRFGFWHAQEHHMKWYCFLCFTLLCHLCVSHIYDLVLRTVNLHIAFDIFKLYMYVWQQYIFLNFFFCYLTLFLCNCFHSFACKLRNSWYIWSLHSWSQGERSECPPDSNQYGSRSGLLWRNVPWLDQGDLVHSPSQPTPTKTAEE